MRQGTRIEATDAAMVRIEKYLAGRPEVAHYASFVGQSAPRFYYNVNPQQPDGAYGQFIVNTKSVKATPALVADLQVKLAAVVPEAMVIVKELQQGSSQEAPIEIRISGDDIATFPPTKASWPYDVTADKNGEVWSGGEFTDTVQRLDPNTGDFIEYLLPRFTNIRRVFVDNSTTPVTFWVGNNHGASIVKLEPLL